MPGSVELFLNVSPDRVRTRRRATSVSVTASNRGLDSVSFRWQFVADAVDADGDLLEWFNPPDGVWPIAATLEENALVSWSIALRPPNKVRPGASVLRPYVDLATGAMARITTNTLTLDVPPSLPKRILKWLRAHWILLSLSVVALSAGVIVWWLLSGRWTTVPNVSGYDEEMAVAAIHDAGLHSDAQSQFSDTADPGITIGQSPGPSARLKRGETVKIFVASSVTIPSVDGLSSSDAQTSLRNLGLEAEFIRQESLERYDSVLGTEPREGTRVPSGSRVSIVLATVDFSKLSGRPLTEVRRILERRGLSVDAYYFDVGRIVDEERGLCRAAGSGADAPCLAVVFGGPTSRRMSVGVIAERLRARRCRRVWDSPDFDLASRPVL